MHCMPCRNVPSQSLENTSFERAAPRPPAGRHGGGPGHPTPCDRDQRFLAARASPAAPM